MASATILHPKRRRRRKRGGGGSGTASPAELLLILAARHVAVPPAFSRPPCPASSACRPKSPAPKSRALLARRAKAVPRGVPAVTPIAVVHAEGAVLTDADGNRLIDFGGGIGVVNTGHRHPGVVEAVREPARPVRPRLLPRLHLRALRRAGRAAQPAHARHAREADLLRQQRRGGGGERGQGGAVLHRPSGRHLLRARLPRPHQPRHGAHRQGDAVQEGIRPVRARGVPDSVSLLLPLRRRTAGRPLLPGRRRAARADPRRDGGSWVGGGHHHGAGAGRGRLRAGAGRVRADPRGVRQAARHPVHRGRDPDRLRPHRQAVRLASTTAWCPTSSRPPSRWPAGCRSPPSPAAPT